MCCLLPLIELSASASAQTSTPSELASLRKSWFESIDRAVKPIDQVYLRELQKLFSHLTRDGKLDDAVLVKSENDAVERNPHAAVALALPADPVPPTQLSNLRQSWLLSRKRAIEPKNETYLRDLERLQDNYTRGKNLEDALVVKDEIEKLKSGRALVSAATNGNGNFIEKRWRTGSGSTFVFKSNGTGTQANASGREWPTSWSMGPDGLITVDAWADDQKATLYFRFGEENSGRFGSTSEILDKTLTFK